MKHANLSLLEDSIRLTGNKGEYSLSPIKVKVPNEDLYLQGLFCKPKSRSGYFYNTAYPKDRIVIHFTAGQLRSDLETLTKNNYHVSVPFVIARDGTIYQLFSSKGWSGHIGKGIGNIGTGNAQDKRTIGIEISNYGILKEANGRLETIYSKPGAADVYCSLEQKELYTKLGVPFRGESYYPNYTSQQYNSLIVLLRYLTATYNIPRAFLPLEKRYKAIDEVLNFKGIVSHVNYRSSGKWDIGPAFQWDQVIQGVQAPAFHLPANKGLINIREGIFPIIDSEDKLAAMLPQAADPSTEDNEYDELSFEEKAAHHTDTGSKKKLYAVIVGISDYQDDVVLSQEGVIFPKLSGCKSDALKMEAYLKEDSSFDVEALVLTDEQATKSNIIVSFQEHLAKAGKDDVVFFYFSGHGTQEYIDKNIFSSETDGKSESIVCYYTEHTAGQALLSDKELRWLIGNLKLDDAHVVTIFDCCHSAGVTRNAALVGNSFNNVVEKRIYYTFPQRTWDEYAFAEKFSVDEFTKAGEGSMLPEGRHIQMSACESYESALEVNAEGVFTKTLLKVLRGSRGAITYSSLLSQIRQYLQGVYEQKPRIYYTGTDDYLFSTLFLNKENLPGAGPLAEVVFNEEYGWILNRGAIHGMEAIENVKVYHPDTPHIFVEANVSRVEIDHSILTAGGLETDRVYLTYVPQLLSEKIKLFIPENTAHLEDQQHILDGLIEELPDKVLLKDSEEEADYVIRYLNGSYYITLPNDPFRPIAKQIDAAGKGSRIELIKQLKHLSAIAFIKKLKNTNAQTALNEDSIKIEISIAGAPYKVYDADELEIDFIKNGNQWVNTLKVRLSNTTDKTLYCSAILLPFDFASFTGLLNPSVYTLTSFSSVELNVKGNTSVPLKMDEAVKWYNWETYKESFKILISTEIFNAETLMMEGLPSPVIPGFRAKPKGVEYAPVAVTEDKGWYTRDIKMIFKNPTYNQISQTNLNMMLEDERTTFFALGLYYEPDNASGFEFKYKLRSDIILVSADDREKSLIIDLANMYSRSKRNRRYRRDIKDFPNKIRIVSEGDSWFQHPLVHDVIDHVSRAFPTYCVAAAADTFRNIMSGDHARGEYFIKAIQREKPAIFLLSGGGNDILGSQFQSYLADNPNNNQDEGQMPERFLKKTLMEEVVSLMEIYRTLFIQLKTDFPDLKIIVHGYDYPIKLNEAKKGWLGRYMIAKGIDRPGDRKAIIRYIMDNFNSLLKAEADKAPNATYLDLRNIVRYDASNGVDQWYDEIHPNHDGFQQVSMRFIQKINELIQPSVNNLLQ